MSAGTEAASLSLLYSLWNNDFALIFISNFFYFSFKEVSKNIASKCLFTKRTIPGDLVTARHGEESLPLQNSVPCLDGVAGAHWDGALTRLDLSSQLTPSFSVRVPVSLI